MVSYKSILMILQGMHYHEIVITGLYGRCIGHIYLHSDAGSFTIDSHWNNNTSRHRFTYQLLEKMTISHFLSFQINNNETLSYIAESDKRCLVKLT